MELIGNGPALHWHQAVHQSRDVHLRHPAAVVVASHRDEGCPVPDQQPDGEHDVVDGLEGPAVVLVVQWLGNDGMRRPVGDGEGRLRLEQIGPEVVGQDVPDRALALRVEEGQVARPVLGLHQHRRSPSSRLSYKQQKNQFK